MDNAQQRSCFSVPPAGGDPTLPSVYAIDFGTSNSLLAAANRGRVFPPVALDPRAEDPSVLRSIIYFSEEGEVFFGAQALQEYVDRGMVGRLLRSLKRFLPAADFRSTRIGRRRFTLEELIGAMLRTMRERANQAFQCDVRRAVFGRPALYSPSVPDDALAEERMRHAAELAGFDEIDFCPEPLAAARDFDVNLSEPRLVLVADFGGGTSDFCVVRMSDRGFSKRDVLGTGGVSVAGDALDGALMKKELSNLFGADVQYRVPLGRNILTMPAALMDMLCTPAKLPLLQAKSVKEFLRDIRSGSLSAQDRDATDRLLTVAEDALGFSVFEAVEHTKRALSTQASAVFSFDYPGIELRREIERARFDAACQRAIHEIGRALDETLARAGLESSDVQVVCLTGGTSRVPLVVRLLVERFGEHKLQRLKGLHSVVGGLAEHARLTL